VAATSLAIGGAAYLTGSSVAAALVMGGALALSSTAAAMQGLAERGELIARFGRVSVAVLLLQDLAVIPLLTLLPLLGGEVGSMVEALGLAALKAIAALLLIVAIGRLLVRPLFRTLAGTRNPEVFAAAVLLVVLGTGWLAAEAGMSMALGAFLAGLLLAETEYRHQVEADIQPFRGLLLGLFFVTVGMSLDVAVLADRTWLAAALLAALLLGKAVILAGLCRAFGLAWPISVRIGLALAEGGEFVFVIFGPAVAQGILATDLVRLLLVVVAISMATTPVLIELGRRLGSILESRRETHAGTLEEDAYELSDHVIVAGYGRVGQAVAMLLRERNVPYVALDVDPHRVAEQRARGVPIHFGDASRIEVLRAAGAARARTIVLTLDDMAMVERAVDALRLHFPTVRTVARARDMTHRARLEAAGASAVVPETIEASLQLGGITLRLSGTSPEDVEQTLSDFRRDDYARLGDIAAPGP
ncbi:MAG: cation:proton antiporter, partial [Alphaproteobacteria bacterium]